MLIHFSGAFVAAPIGGLIWALAAMALRLTTQWILAKIRGHRFKAFDRPAPDRPHSSTGYVIGDGDEDDRQDSFKASGKFF